jgi:DnaJ-class molecular chaperone
MKNKTKWIVTAVLAALTVAALAAGFKCSTCQGSGWNGAFKCQSCGGDGVIGN